ncbi:Uncharacterised protein [Vibrio cholerae]|uniref:Uncharacterized protein n=1 Tax=Vibrio cholerae TaxID=666 RepID=A0A655YK71_VIBCL|nr:Uncharacterised protein [Vibrio cholerae]
MTVSQVTTWCQILTSLNEMRFNHHPENCMLALRNLRRNIFRHYHLTFELLRTVRVAEIDHHFLW